MGIFVLFLTTHQSDLKFCWFEISDFSATRKETILHAIYGCSLFDERGAQIHTMSSVNFDCTVSSAIVTLRLRSLQSSIRVIVMSDHDPKAKHALRLCLTVSALAPVSSSPPHSCSELSSHSRHSSRTAAVRHATNHTLNSLCQFFTP